MAVSDVAWAEGIGAVDVVEFGVPFCAWLLNPLSPEDMFPSVLFVVHERFLDVSSCESIV